MAAVTWLPVAQRSAGTTVSVVAVVPEGAREAQAVLTGAEWSTTNGALVLDWSAEVSTDGGIKWSTFVAARVYGGKPPPEKGGAPALGFSLIPWRNARVRLQITLSDAVSLGATGYVV